MCLFAGTASSAVCLCETVSFSPESFFSSAPFRLLPCGRSTFGFSLNFSRYRRRAGACRHLVAATITVSQLLSSARRLPLTLPHLWSEYDDSSCDLEMLSSSFLHLLLLARPDSVTLTPELVVLPENPTPLSGQKSTSNFSAVPLPLGVRGNLRMQKANKRHRPTAKQRVEDEIVHEKRYVWGTSIIQDNSSTSGLPPIGSNVNQFSSSYTIATTTLSINPFQPPAPPPTSTSDPKPVLSFSSTASPATSTTIDHSASSSEMSSSPLEKPTKRRHRMSPAESIRSALHRLNQTLAEESAALPTSSTSSISESMPEPSPSPTSRALMSRAESLRSALHAHGKQRKREQKLEHNRRWIQGTYIIQNGDTVTQAENTTPGYTIVAPTFPLPESSASPTTSSASTTKSTDASTDSPPTTTSINESTLPLVIISAASMSTAITSLSSAVIPSKVITTSSSSATPILSDNSTVAIDTAGVFEALASGILKAASLAEARIASRSRVTVAQSKMAVPTQV